MASFNFIVSKELEVIWLAKDFITQSIVIYFLNNIKAFPRLFKWQSFLLVFHIKPPCLTQYIQKVGEINITYFNTFMPVHIFLKKHFFLLKYFVYISSKLLAETQFFQFLETVHLIT